MRVVGNYGFNALFSLVAGKRITDLGSGLNLYAVEPLKTEYYKKFPDTLYFNDCMILALCQLKQRVLFFPCLLYTSPASRRACGCKLRSCHPCTPPA